MIPARLLPMLMYGGPRLVFVGEEVAGETGAIDGAVGIVASVGGRLSIKPSVGGDVSVVAGVGGRVEVKP